MGSFAANVPPTAVFAVHGHALLGVLAALVARGDEDGSGHGTGGAQR